MTQFPHDEFAKELLPELYQDYGTVIPSADVKSERRQVDVLFIPDKPVPSTPDTLGLFGKLAQQPCLFEIYRNAIQTQQIKDCLSKLFDLQHTRFQKNDPPAYLWIITPTVSPTVLAQYGATQRPNWPGGIYDLVTGLDTSIIAVHQLPQNNETLWLRLLGRGKIQSEAIQDLRNLPVSFYHKEKILELVYALFHTLELNQRQSLNNDPEDEVLIMSLRTVFRERLAQELEDGLQQGRQKGLQEGRQEIVTKLLKHKFSNLSLKIEQQLNRLSIANLDQLAEAILDFETVTDLENWLERLTNDRP